MKNDSPYKRTFDLCLNKAKDQGFVEYFYLKDRQHIVSEDRRTYNPEQFQIVNAFRFARDNDPADRSVVYMIQTYDGRKGTLIEDETNANFNLETNVRQGRDGQNHP